MNTNTASMHQSSSQPTSTPPTIVHENPTIAFRNNKSTQGIDIAEALSILSIRAATQNEDHAHKKNVPTEIKQMGQTLELFQDNADEWNETKDDKKKKNHHTTATASEKRDEVMHESQDDTARREAMERERREREVKIKAELESMSVSQLLNSVLEIQQQRALTYTEFDRGLDLVLKTGNFSTYPSTVANATASFAVLSNNVNAISDILHKSDRKEHRQYYSILKQLQGHEKNKLNLTAALHLEQMRTQNYKSTLSEAPESSEDDKMLRMLCDGVTSLKQRIAECIEHINDLLDELRYADMEEDEEDS